MTVRIQPMKIIAVLIHLVISGSSSISVLTLVVMAELKWGKEFEVQGLRPEEGR